MLWAKAAGRCQFAGCNEPLWRSSVTQETINKAQKAHIYALSDNGPRSKDSMTYEKINDLNNLMLVCHQCHQKMDKEKDGGLYTAGLLQGWKMPECMRFASAASALKCTELGGRKGIPSLEKVNTFIKKS